MSATWGMLGVQVSNQVVTCEDLQAIHSKDTKSTRETRHQKKIPRETKIFTVVRETK